MLARMPIVTLRDLYAAELHDLFDAEQQILQELPGMAARATSAELRNAFEDHYEQTLVHIERLELLFRQLDERPRLQPSEAMRGLVQGARRRAADAERGEVLDAALIAAAQRIEHYEIAAYGCARSYADTLGDPAAARLLQQTLDEEGRADQRLTEIAQRGINAGAGEDLLPRATTYRSRLRYLAGSDLQSFGYGHHRIVSPDQDDLGTIDGFIADGETGRPIYYVVDSGGWFSGRRYVIPVAQLELDIATQTFRTELTRELLRRYPEFSAGAFVAMDDDSAARYERRLLEAVLPFRHQLRRATAQPTYSDLPIYQPPPWLVTDIWTTEAGAAATEARGKSPREVRRRARLDGRGDDRSERERAADAPQDTGGKTQKPGDTRRIEKYPDR